MNEMKYFDKPTQVVYYDVDGDCWKSGIAYRDEIICACCGGIIEISEIYEFASAEIAQPIFPYHNWCDITDDIIGGEMPEEWCEIYDDPTPEESEPVEAWHFTNLSDKED